MRVVLFVLAMTLVGCTTVNVYPQAESVIVIQKNSARNLDNPYDRRRDY